MPSAMHQSKVYSAKRLEAEQAISIDGCGSDPSWQLAHALADFTFPWSTRVPAATEFRALCNQRQLFFRFDVTDSDVVLGSGEDARQKVIGSDRAEIFFSTGPKLDPYYGIEIDPRGEVLAYEARFHRQMNWDWACDGLFVATSLTDIGYIVEGRIPLATFQGLGCLHRDGAGEYLMAGLYRAEFSRDRSGGAVIEDWMSWVDPHVATPDFHVPKSFGTIRLGE